MRIIYFMIGMCFLFLGALGAVLPILPTFPFLIVSAYCFARSNSRMHHWLIHTKMYQKVVIPLKDEKKMTLKNKLFIMTTVTIFMTFGFVMMNEVIIGQIVLGCVWFFHLYYFIFKIKTKKAEDV